MSEPVTDPARPPEPTPMGPLSTDGPPCATCGHSRAAHNVDAGLGECFARQTVGICPCKQYVAPPAEADALAPDVRCPKCDQPVPDHGDLVCVDCHNDALARPWERLERMAETAANNFSAAVDAEGRCAKLKAELARVATDLQVAHAQIVELDVVRTRVTAEREKDLALVKVSHDLAVAEHGWREAAERRAAQAAEYFQTYGQHTAECAMHRVRPHACQAGDCYSDSDHDCCGGPSCPVCTAQRTCTCGFAEALAAVRPLANPA